MDRIPLGKMMTGVFTATVVLALGLPASVTAQETGTIVGGIVDAQTARPIAGAQITVVGTGHGSVADDRGRYLILGVPAGEVTVRVRRLGYGTADQRVTVVAGQTVAANFELRIAVVPLDEIVVTGVGEATQRRQLSTSVAVIGSDVIDAAPVQSLDQLLQGRVAGASISAVSAQPGTASLMNFRGTSSVFGPTTPVIYVDGVRVDNALSTSAGTGGEQSSALADLLTSDIERVEITRGGAASTLFGSDAATGVIQVFTRRGAPGPPRITARVEQGVDVPDLRYLLDAGIIYPEFVHPEHPDFNAANPRMPADFVAQNFFQSGHYQAYHANVSGGSADATYAVTGRLQQSDGIQPQNDNEVFNLRGNVQARLNDRVRAHFAGGYTRSNYGRLYNGTAIADPITALEVGDVMFFTDLPHSSESLPRALEIFLMPEITEGVNRFQFSTGLTYEVSEYFATRATVGVDNRTNHQRIFQPIGFVAGDAEGSLNRRQRDFLSVTMDVAGTLVYPATGNVTSSLTVGVQGFRDNTSIINGFGRRFALPGTKTFDEAAEVDAFEENLQVFTGGVYVDERIGLYDRLFLNLGLRVDAGTTFGDRVQSELYPKAGLAYAVSEESFFRPLERWVDDLRLRAAYGETGKFPPPFLRDRTFSAVSFRDESAPRFDNPGNEDLRAEVTGTFETGFDASFLENRVGVDLTYFDARTRDALFFVPEPPAEGLGTQIRNVGTIRNSGWEIAANAHVLHTPNFSWHVGATWSTVDNRVTDMGGAADFSIFSSGGSNQRVSEGRTVGAWFVTTPIDTNDDGLLDGSELQFTGTGPMPTSTGSVRTRVELFQRLQLSMMADWARGHDVFDWGSVWATFNGIIRREVVDCPRSWAEGDTCEPSYRYPRRHDLDGEDVGRYPQGLARSEFLLPGDWFKIREISVRYALPAEWTAGLGLGRSSIYGSIRNVATFTHRDNKLVDPELAGIVDFGLVPLGGITSITISPPRSFRIGVEAAF